MVEYELDSDELDEDSQRNLNQTHAARNNSDQSMPLLVGLLDTRRSVDASLPLQTRNGSATEHVDLEELAQKRTAGGGLIDSVANMANSILGAGACSSGMAVLLLMRLFRHYWYDERIPVLRLILSVS